MQAMLGKDWRQRMKEELCDTCDGNIEECGERHNYGETYGYCDKCGIEVMGEAVYCDAHTKYSFTFNVGEYVDIIVDQEFHGMPRNTCFTRLDDLKWFYWNDGEYHPVTDLLDSLIIGMALDKALEAKARRMAENIGWSTY